MGGRGSHAYNTNTQIKISDYLNHQLISDIKQVWDNYRSLQIGAEGSSTPNQSMRKRCACCLQYSLPAFSEYHQCPVCGWIDDPTQNKDRLSTIGRNPISLQEAQNRWATVR